MVAELKEAASLFGGPADSRGGNFYDLLGKIADNAGPVIANLTKGPTLRQPIRTPVGSLSGSASDIVPVPALPEASEKPDSTDTQPTTSTESEAQPMGEREIVFQVANQLCKCFRLKPAKKPIEVVSMLDLFIRQESATFREQIKQNYQSVVFNLCEAELEADWSDPESTVENRETFGVWCAQVFDAYADPERNVVLI